MSGHSDPVVFGEYGHDTTQAITRAMNDSETMFVGVRRPNGRFPVGFVRPNRSAVGMGSGFIGCFRFSALIPHMMDAQRTKIKRSVLY